MDEPNARELLARLDERTKWIKEALEGIQLQSGISNARMDRLEQDMAVIKVKSGFIASFTGIVSSIVTNIIAAVIFWKRISNL